MKKEEQDSVIKSAQFRKSLSIAYFSSLNAAIELVKGSETTSDVQKKIIVEWRDWFLAEHKNYYATVIANVGVNYKAEESIAKLKAVKNLEELKAVWISLSEDERRDSEILKVTQDLKKKYSNEKN